MGNIPILDKIPGESYTATEWNQMKNDGINDNDTRISLLEGSNEVNVANLSDLPAPVGGVISLVTADTKYIFSGIVDLGVNVLSIEEDGIALMGKAQGVDGFSTTGTTSAVTATDRNIVCKEMTINATGITEVFTFSNSTTNLLDLFRVTVTTDGKLGTINTGISFSVVDCVFISFTDGFTFSGVFLAARFEGTLAQAFTGTLLDLDTSTYSALDVSANAVIGQLAGAQFMNVAASGANIAVDGRGTITGNKFVDQFGGLTAITGYTSFEPQWTVGANTSNIKSSDRLQPSGFGNYDDDVTANISVTTAWTKVVINGLGTATRTDRLPNSIQGIGELFDVSTNVINSITDGDSYMYRLLLNVASTSGNPTRLEFALDIGGSDVSPGIIILNDSRALRGGSDQPIVFVSNYFTGTTFLANKGRFFVRTDTGSCIIDSRSTEIQRVSSGAV
jgi:hypothetical protein